MKQTGKEKISHKIHNKKRERYIANNRKERERERERKKNQMYTDWNREANWVFVEIWTTQEHLKPQSTNSHCSFIVWVSIYERTTR